MDVLLVGGWWLVPLIFLARAADVTLGTFRSIVVFRGYRGLAAAIGFIEILIWVMAAGSVLNNLDAWYLGVAYAGGFAAGNYVGMWLESRVAMGQELVRAVRFGEDDVLANALQRGGYEVITVDAHGGGGEPAEVVYVVEKRRNVGRLIDFIHEQAADAVVTVAGVKEHGARLTPLDQKPVGPAWRVWGKRK